MRNKYIIGIGGTIIAATIAGGAIFSYTCDESQIFFPTDSVNRIIEGYEAFFNEINDDKFKIF